MSVMGNTVGTTAPSPNYAEQDESHSTFIHYKPDAVIERALRAAEAALPRSGGTMTGPLKVLEPADPDHAASRGYVDKKHYAATVQLPAQDWSDTAPYTQSIKLEGILASDRPHFGVVYSENWEEEMRSFGMVNDLETSDGVVLFTCFRSAPEVDLTIQLEVNR